jgi:hypothetical protein
VRRIWLAALTLVAGCGVEPSGVDAGGEAPTGVSPGVNLYFLNAKGDLEPQLRDTGRLGTVSEALTLLLLGPGGSEARTEIARVPMTRVVVTSTPDVITVNLPLTINDVTPKGIDQIVCTALGVHVQAGGSRSTRVRVRFTLPTDESEVTRTCSVLS